MDSQLEIFADYFQVAIHDSNFDLSAVIVAADWWTEKDDKMMLSVKENGKLIVLGTFRNMIVPVHVVINKIKPDIDLREWDCISQCSLFLETGKLFVGELFGEVLPSNMLSIEKGFWGLLYLAGGRNTISEDGLKGNDNYEIHLWPIGTPIPNESIKKLSQAIISMNSIN